MGTDGRDCLSEVMERETDQRNSEGWERAEPETTKTFDREGEEHQRGTQIPRLSVDPHNKSL